MSLQGVTSPRTNETIRPQTRAIQTLRAPTDRLPISPPSAITLHRDLKPEQVATEGSRAGQRSAAAQVPCSAGGIRDGTWDLGPVEPFFQCIRQCIQQCIRRVREDPASVGGAWSRIMASWESSGRHRRAGWARTAANLAGRRSVPVSATAARVAGTFRRPQSSM